MHVIILFSFSTYYVNRWEWKLNVHHHAVHIYLNTFESDFSKRVVNEFSDKISNRRSAIQLTQKMKRSSEMASVYEDKTATNGEM